MSINLNNLSDRFIFCNLENIIKDFTSKQTDILVCTTIIESGIDMPNVNTLIVNNSHKFGLSQLYQMKGRMLIIPRSKIW